MDLETNNRTRNRNCGHTYRFYYMILSPTHCSFFFNLCEVGIYKRKKNKIIKLVFFSLTLACFPLFFLNLAFFLIKKACFLFFMNLPLLVEKVFSFFFPKSFCYKFLSQFFKLYRLIDDGGPSLL